MTALRYRSLVRRVPCDVDPVGLYARLATDEKAAGLFRNAAEARATLAFEPLVRVTARGRCTRIVPGDGIDVEQLFTALSHALAAHGPLGRHDVAFEFIAAAVDPALDEETRLKAPGPLDPVRALIIGDAVIACDEPARRLALGLFGYDLVDAFESLPAARIADHGPALDLLVPGLTVDVDERARAAEIVALLPAEATPATEARRLGQVARLAERIALAQGDDVPPPAARCAAESELDDGAFAALVERLQRHVAAGDVFQIVPSRAFRAPCREPLAALRRLACLNPSAYTFHLRTPERELFGCSPESALKVADGVLTLSPVAGTRSRARRADGTLDAEQDARLMAELHLDAKETAEHMMLVDLARNDVARVAAPGSRAVSELLRLTRHSHVMHLASEVRGRLRDGLDALHAWAACANPGTLTGAPKLRAMEILRGVEPAARGAYGGGLGLLRGDGTFDAAIVIRSAEVRHGVATIRAGAGVVLDSVPAREAEETRRKAAAVLVALGATTNEVLS